MKKVLIISALVALVAAVNTVNAADNIKVYVDGRQLDFDVNPVIDNSRTLVPVRAIFEALGAEVTWNPETRTASAVKGTDTVDITIDSSTLYKNSVPVTLDVPAKIVNDRTMVPVRAVSESFDSQVDWNGDTREITIKTKSVSENKENEKPSEDKPKTASKIQFTDADIKALQGSLEDLRYDFEQSSFPAYIFENSGMIYEKLTAEKFESEVKDFWNIIAAAYTMEIAMNSETTYTIGSEASDDIVGYFSGAFTAAGIDADNIFEDIECTESEKGTRVGIVSFKTADGVVDCKYIGIAVSKDGKPRYFTAENDFMQSGKWFLCEVTAKDRGTHDTFDKTDDSKADLKTFESAVIGLYEGK